MTSKVQNFKVLDNHQNFTIEMIRDAIAQLIAAPNQRYQMSTKGRKLIDGYGNSRVLAKMGGIYAENS